MAVMQQQQEYYANRNRNASITYTTGDKVWLNLKNITTDRPVKKLDWIHAKYTVTRTFQDSPHFVELDVPRGVFKKFHTSLIRLAANDPLESQTLDDTQPAAIQNQENGEDEYGVEAILRCRTRRIGRGSRREALVQWIGYARPTWEPLRNFEETTALDRYEEQYGNANTNDGPSPEA